MTPAPRVPFCLSFRILLALSFRYPSILLPRKEEKFSHVRDDFTFSSTEKREGLLIGKLLLEKAAVAMYIL